MFFSKSIFYIIPLSCLLLAGIEGCSHKKPILEESMTTGLDNSDFGTSDNGKAFGLQTVFFGYDTSLLSGQAKGSLKKNAEILKLKANLKVQIEGYCDERGGVQYNIALGEKRANSVKQFLQRLGISENRLSTVSFGKERPLATSDTEEAYAKNRRSNFAIIGK